MLEEKLAALTAAVLALTAAINNVSAQSGLTADNSAGDAEKKSKATETKTTKSKATPAKAAKQVEEADIPTGEEEAENKITFEYLGEKVRKLAATNKDAVLTILAEQGAKKLGDVDPSKWWEVDVALTKLENKLLAAKKTDDDDDIV